VAAAVGVGALLVADVAVGRTYFGPDVPVIVAGAAMVVAVIVAARALFAATLAAALASLAVTAWIGWSNHAGLLSTQSGLPGMAEIAGLCLLAGWSLRSLSGALAASAGLAAFAASIGIVSREPERSYRPLLVLAVGLALAVAVAVGLYLRWLDHERARGEDVVRQDERLTIARELHDVVAHYVTAMVVQAQAAQLVWDERPNDARRAVKDIESAGSEALLSMRRIVTTLRDDDSDHLVPVATLDDLEKLAGRSDAWGLPVRLHLEDMPDRLPAVVGASVHRIIQEAITNAQRHAAGATLINVRIASTVDVLSVDIDDDGRSAAPRDGRRGYGVVGMTERVEALGGHLRAGPVADGGWSVHVELPMATA
jgi:signal transduction histidine kinase